MESTAEITEKPHAVCVACPGQGHINPMLKLAKLLHQKGFFITFVNTQFIHRRLLNSGGTSALRGLPDFRFASIPDGLPDDDPRTDIPRLSLSMSTTCVQPLCDLLSELSRQAPPPSCIVSDGVMSFSLEAAERFRLPEALFWTPSACGFLCYTQYRKLVEKGYFPLRDMDDLSNGYLDTIVDWFPGVKKMRLRDVPSFIKTTDPQDIMLNFAIHEAEAVPRAKALILNTFHTLEQDAIHALSAMFAKIYTIGPLQHMTTNHIHHQKLNSINLTFWEEESECLNWLNSRDPESVVYVNFGSITVLTVEQLTEFAWGLANSNKPFLWIIRPDAVAVVAGGAAALPPEFVAETEDRSMLVNWCPQERVLRHPAIGVFLTHCGWNSTLESIVGGVPVLCWPFFAEQQTNCRLCCVEWGIGMEIGDNVNRDEVEKKVREMMDGERGKKMRENGGEWNRKAEEAAAVGGSSCMNLDKLINEVLLQ